MRKSRFTEEQIIGILQAYAAVAKVSVLWRRHGMSDATLYNWKAKYGGMTVSEQRLLKDSEAENSELKRLLAEAMLDNAGRAAGGDIQINPDVSSATGLPGAAQGGSDHTTRHTQEVCPPQNIIERRSGFRAEHRVPQ